MSAFWVGANHDLLGPFSTTQESSCGTLEYYEPIVLSATDYYPYGHEMPGRNYQPGSNYRYGFNGKEADRDDEWGSLTHYDYGWYEPLG